MKTKWIASAILASVMAVPAFAQVGVYIGSGIGGFEVIEREHVEARRVAQAPVCGRVLGTPSL